MPIDQRILAIVASIFDVPLARVRPDSSPDNVETWDSLRHLNLVLALEDEFGIQFSPEEIEQLLSVELIDSLVQEKLLVRKP
jgi:acyl carrier protein